MLLMPEDSPTTITLIGIDPGSHNLGVGILEVDIVSLEIVSSSGKTYSGAKLGKNTFYTETHGDRAGRIRGHRENLSRIFRIAQPYMVASESPFSNRKHPQVYGVLTEVVEAIRGALFDYDQTKSLLMIDPPTVKNGMGAPGNCGKDVMREKLLGLTDLSYDGFIPIEQLDEHSVDGLAVARCLLARIRNLL